MPHHKSAAKRVITNEKDRKRNVSGRTRMRSARCTFSKIPGTERQPSAQSDAPSRAMISGLINTLSWSCVSDVSTIIRRRWTSTCVAASPTPGTAPGAPGATATAAVDQWSVGVALYGYRMNELEAWEVNRAADAQRAPWFELHKKRAMEAAKTTR